MIVIPEDRELVRALYEHYQDAMNNRDKGTFGEIFMNKIASLANHGIINSQVSKFFLDNHHLNHLRNKQLHQLEKEDLHNIDHVVHAMLNMPTRPISAYDIFKLSCE